ncbi:FAD-binding protein [Neorhizobium sp. NCHU2750]|nr:FAD-binding protein [Neorhizobium sp. NCHU2750]
MDSLTPTSKPSQNFPQIDRVRHELKRRELTVEALDYVTPLMLRITLRGEALSDFTSLGADDHIKVVVPGADGEMEMRDYTPRSYDNAAGRLVLDFAVHEAGPATKWALEAKIGSTITIAGPRGSAVISGVSNWVLVGDETALPAMGRRIEEAKAGDRITAIGVVTDKGEEQEFASTASLRMNWVHRPASAITDPAPIIAALDGIELTADTFVWVAAEASVARAIKTYLTATRNHPLPWIKAAGYWTRGMADTAMKIVD